MEIYHNDVFLDFETRSAAPLSGKNGVGAWRYSIDPSTRVLCLGYAFGLNEPKLWIEGQPQPQDLISAVESGKRIHGWNSMSFERAIFENQCKAKLGWVTPHPEQYYDTMLDALTLALPAALEDCCKAVGTYNQKMEAGKKLIQFLCKPISTGKKKGQFRERIEFRKEYAELYDYCKQDVRTEREIYTKLPHHIEGKERQLALIVMRMNERGLPIDTALVDAVIEGLESEAILLHEKFYDLTGIDRPTMRAQFMDWLACNGLPLENMQAGTLAELDLTNVSYEVQEALNVYNDSNNASTAKFKKIKEMLCPDNTVKNNLIFNKANTGRLAGAGFQAQNLPAVSSKGSEEVLESFLMRDYDFIRLYCGVQHGAKMMIRPSIKAPVHHKFLSGDLSGVEARGTAWIAGEFKMLDNFSKGIDAYVSSASGMYGIPLSEVTKQQRQSGKIAVLSGGFGGGYRALLRMSKKFGMHMSDTEAKKIIKDFRRGRPMLVKTWENFGEAAMTACNEGGKVYVKGTRNLVAFIREGNYLYMILPSGRRISFPFPEVREELFFGRLQSNVTAMWVDSSPGGNRKWKRRTITGANFFQSAVQASCRDILFDSHLLLEEEGFPLILSVHDEALSMVPDDPAYSEQEYKRLMCNQPDWCLELPIGSEVWSGYRYEK